MEPTIGRIVIYRLNQYDRDELKALGADLPNNGAEVVPAVIVRVFSATCVNLRVLVDGRQALWATSRSPGDGDGQWSWPVRA